MRQLQNAIEETLKDVPIIAIEALLKDKLKSAGLKASAQKIREAAKHIMSGRKGSFQFSDADDDINIEITDADLEAVIKKVENFLDNQLPDLISTTAEKSARKVYTDLIKKWPDEYAAQVADTAGFKDRLEKRYGKALAKLRMLLTIGREMVNEKYQRKQRESRGGLSHWDDVTFRLHARACQVTTEIILLLENGFADGAMARWRTLHEVATIASVIGKHGPEMAERYVMYQIVEAKEALTTYEACQEELGYRPYPKKLANKIRADYERMIKKYGEAFGGKYGWAAPEIAKSPRDRLNFEKLEKAADMGMMRSHYKMASYNVHASPKGAYFRLGQMNDSKILLGGASNAGLVEPAQNAAVTFAKLSILLCGDENSWTFDEVIYSKIVNWLMFEIPQEFKKADDKLQRDDKKFRSVGA